MRKHLALLALALGLSALAQEVAVYPGFAEVKEPVDLPPAAWVYLAGEKLVRILPGSLRLLGVEETERVFQGSAVLFRYRGEGKAALRYLYTGLSGEVFYTLDGTTLTAWARLKLEGEALKAERLTLFAGEVRAKVLPQAALRALEESPENPFVPFLYELPPRTLFPGTTELPFLRQSVEPERLLRYQGPFRTQGGLPLERGLRFLAPFPLAPGPLEVVEEGRFLGQALLPATPEGGVAEAWLGQDLRARLVREVALLSQGEKEATYRVETRLENPYPYPVRLLLAETFPPGFRLDFPGAVLLPEGYRLEAVLDPLEARSFRYRLTLPR